MNWENIIGQEKLISTLRDAIENGRVAHAQLFVGEEGYGGFPLAMAYAQEILTRENAQAVSKIEHFNHLDLHFSFPIYSEKTSLSKNFFPEWREMILDNPYASFQDFAEKLDAKNKQLFISVDEVEEWSNLFRLKSYEGGTKILIIWRADKMRVEAANKFLKFLEEPPAKTLIFLLADKLENMLETILSRCQIVEIPRIEDEAIFKSLIQNQQTSEEEAQSIVYQSQGNYNTALKIIKNEGVNDEFEELFIHWVRNAFQAKKKPEVLRNIIYWAREIADWNREKQRDFLNYCIEIFRLALLNNYGAENIVYKKLTKNNFKWEVFYKYIHGANIELILEEINEADIHLYRNANDKIVWTDLGIKLIRNIHKTP
ncbi:MAG: DNA polymerase III subunit delta' [Flavobacteriaceae bacterium]|nr:DNA polymerase III subunit delta' [Flavobacteriaceae bacterium]